MNIVYCLQHSERVRPLTVSEWAIVRGLDLRVVRVDLAESFPEVGSVRRLVVLGGQMNTDQVNEYPWLALERDWIREVIMHGRALVLGICLGSQLIAEALGGSVGRAEHPEVGWQKIERTRAGEQDPLFSQLPDSFEAMQWHFDQWSLPKKAVLTATSQGTSTQAFSYADGRVNALQFHPEFTCDRTRELTETADDLPQVGGFVQAPASFLADRSRFARLREICFQILDRALDIRSDVGSHSG